MTMLRAIEVKRGLDWIDKDASRDVFLGTHFESIDGTVKVWNGDQLLYLHQGMIGAVKDIGSEEDYRNTMTARFAIWNKFNQVQADAALEYWSHIKVTDG